MVTFHSLFGNVDISTRPKRRRVVSLIISELTAILKAEELYIERMPKNFREGYAYVAAEDSIGYLDDAIQCLEDAY